MKSKFCQYFKYGFKNRIELAYHSFDPVNRAENRLNWNQTS